MVYFGLEPGVAVCKAQMNPLRFGGTPFVSIPHGLKPGIGQMKVPL